MGFGSHGDSTGLKLLASQTGGSFHAAATSTTLSGIYRSIGRELRRTWRVRYLTTARPGDKLELKASVGKLGSDGTTVTIPDPYGSSSTANGKPSPLLPNGIYGKAGDVLFTLLVALLVLAAGILAASTLRGSWLKRRLSPHVEPSRGRAAKHRTGRDRLAMLSGLFRVTESTFAHRRQWRNMQLLLERADLPLRTVEFAWLLIGCSFVLAVFAAIISGGAIPILACFLVGGFVPYLVVWMKAKRRMQAFEDQLPDQDRKSTRLNSSHSQT